MIFPVVIYGCEGWTIKKAEPQRIDALWTVVLEKTLESPLDCMEIQPVYPKGNQSWIFIGKTDAETKTLATWCEELTHLKRPWCWERLRAGGQGDDRGWDGWMASLIRRVWVWANSGSWWWTGTPGVLQSIGSQSQTRLSNWTEVSLIYSQIIKPLIKNIFSSPSSDACLDKRLLTFFLCSHQSVCNTILLRVYQTFKCRKEKLSKEVA